MTRRLAVRNAIGVVAAMVIVVRHVSVLAGMNYQGMNYQGMNYQGMNYQGMNYQGMNYQGMNYQGMNYQGMNYQGMNYQGMNYQGMNYQGMNYQGMNYQGMNYQGMNYQGMNLSGHELSGHELPGPCSPWDDRSGKSGPVIGFFGLELPLQTASIGLAAVHPVLLPVVGLSLQGVQPPSPPQRFRESDRSVACAAAGRSWPGRHRGRQLHLRTGPDRSVTDPDGTEGLTGTF